MVVASGIGRRNVLADQLIEVGFQGRLADLSRHIKGKSRDQEGFGRRLADAAGTQVKQRLFTELPHGGPMAAFYVVGEDLELGFRVDSSLFANDEVVILLEGICF